jgi:wobble nucleotide-excising tRNase
MIEKINHIKNIGRFYNVSIQGTPDSDPSFKKFNLIYADNGTGKSTFSTILKSLWKNDPQRLIEKRTIGCADESNISIQVGGKTHIFQNGKWNKIPEIAIEIFDEEFVAKNVFSPNGVELENRRELFNYIVLGEENVAKVAEVKKLNDLINGDLKTKIDDAETKLKKAAIIQDIKILDSASELDDNTLKTMRSSVEENNKIITHAERITKEKKLENITDFENISFAEVISADLSSLSLAADYKTHVQIHNEWIKDGMEILKSEAKESCPFCFQAVKNNSAIATYKTLFSEEYETLRKKVGDQILSTDRTYSEAAVKNVIDLINRNSERCAFWHKLDKKIPESLALDISLEEVVGIFKNTLKNLLERKKDNLLEAISSNENEREGLSNENKFREAIAKYNLLIAEFNTFIQVVKDASRDIEELKLKNANNHINVVCNDVGYRDEKTSKIYKTLKEYRKQKKDAETQIKLLREEIDQASLKVLEDYEQSINRELENFGVEFSIKGIKRRSDSSRTESVHFNIYLKGESFNPNGSSDNPYKLSNTLSTGDKSTLAFAFFIAKYREKDISNQILVFDDPITSLDFFRKTQTKNTIMRFSKNAAQVIVLTHSMEFARLFRHVAKERFIQIKKNNLVSGLSYIPYNKFSDMSIEKHSYNYNLIQQYIADPASVNRLEVMKSVRPYAETTIRQYRADFASLSLGQMIDRLKNQKNICEYYIEDLENIDGIIVSESSHGSSEIDANDYENITDDELMTVCKKVSQISAPPPRQDNKQEVMN